MTHVDEESGEFIGTLDCTDDRSLDLKGTMKSNGVIDYAATWPNGDTGVGWILDQGNETLRFTYRGEDGKVHRHNMLIIDNPLQ